MRMFFGLGEKITKPTMVLLDYEAKKYSLFSEVEEITDETVKKFLKTHTEGGSQKLKTIDGISMDDTLKLDTVTK